MNLTMKEILDKFEDCDIFLLTGGTLGYNITEEEFSTAIEKMEASIKEEQRKIYLQNKDKFINYPDFDDLFEEIKQECYDFDSEENREYYLQKHFNDEEIENFKKLGFTNERIDEMKKDFFRCGFICDMVGKTTKYGKENEGFFWHLYHDLGMMMDRKNAKEKYCINNGKNIIDQIPEELKEHFLYYEVSYYNSVTISENLMINYYFKLNDDTKKYLLQFKNDFDLNELEDLTLYKDKEIKFYSCTHEEFNSINN